MFYKCNLSGASYDMRENLICFDVHAGTKLRTIFFPLLAKNAFTIPLPLGGTQEFVTLLSFSIYLPSRSPLLYNANPWERLNYLRDMINRFKNKINELS